MPQEFAYVGAGAELALAAWNGPEASIDCRPLIDVRSPDLIGDDGSQPIGLAAPSWSPDGTRLAFSLIYQANPQQAGSALAILERDTASARIVFQGTPGIAALIAPGLPHYVNWSTDGRHLALLAQTPAGMTLFILDAAGLKPATPVVSGAPLFFAWSPSSDALVVHRGNDLMLVPASAPESPSILTRGGVACQLPIWHPSGESILLARHATGGIILYSLSPAGDEQELRHIAAAGAAMMWRPGQEQIGIATRPLGDPQQMRGFWIASADGTQFDRLADLPLDTFYWSDDGSELAIASTSPATGLCNWSTIAIDSHETHHFAPFHQSSDFAIVSAFFEQYATSHHFWSGLGDALLACGRVLANGTPLATSGDSIYVQPVEAGSHTVFAAHGTFASWRPSPRP